MFWKDKAGIYRRSRMSGTKEGAKKAAATNKAKHGEDFYKRIGSKGGKRTGLKGFALNPALARVAGAKGGRNGRRGVSKKNTVSICDSDSNDNAR